MSDEPLERVRRTLRLPADRLTALDALDPADAATFAAAVERAVADQARQIDDSLEAALRFVPRLLRGRARNLLFPGGRHG